MPQRFFLQEQGGFRLGAGEAELPCITRQPPSGMIVAQHLKTFRNIGFAEPFDLVFLGAFYGFQAFGRNELNGSRAILPDMGNKRKDVACRYLEFCPQPTKHEFIIRQEAP
jgi:hypothetical protein